MCSRQNLSLTGEAIWLAMLRKCRPPTRFVASIPSL